MNIGTMGRVALGVGAGALVTGSLYGSYRMVAASDDRHREHGGKGAEGARQAGMTFGAIGLTAAGAMLGLGALTRPFSANPAAMAASAVLALSVVAGVEASRSR